MKSAPRRTLLIAALAAIGLLAGCTTPPLALSGAAPSAAAPAVAHAAVLAGPPAMRIEGVPALPTGPLQAAQRCTLVAGHTLVDWHPTRREMLVSHRVPGASTTQFLRLRAPMAPPEPLTDGADPVAGASYEPTEGRYMGTAIDWMATHPRLDAQRVLVQGGSYGGYMALAASTRLADRIAGAVSVGGIGNFVSFLENTESYRRDLRRLECGDERDPAMRQFLQDISPLTHAARITKPWMVVQGENDPRLPWTESEQIVRSLQARGTPVWYLLADHEGHGFARCENADCYFAALMQFVQQTLRS